MNAEGRIGVLRRIKPYASLCRNILLSLVKYRSFSAALNAFAALCSQFAASIKNTFVKSKNAKCNVCGWSGATFYPSRGIGVSRKKQICLVCESFPRQRFFKYYLDNYISAAPSSKVLHVSPELYFPDILTQRFPRGYVSVDISDARDPKVLSDLTKLGFRDSSFDLVICFEVLEHIENDRTAMEELFRILKPGGGALITVPMDRSLEKTLEKGRPDPLDSNHYRLYGRDFDGKLESVGFDVSFISAVGLAQDIIIKEMNIGEAFIFSAEKPAA